MPNPKKTDADRLADADEIIRRLRSQVNLQASTIRGLRREADTAESIKREIYGIANTYLEVPDWTLTMCDPGLPGVPMTMWSDWHWGEKVDAAQVGGVNSYNSDIAKQRVKRLLKVTCELTLRHMVNPQYPGIVCCLGGDMITGVIHEELLATNCQPVAVSIEEVTEALIWGIQQLHNNFGKVFVPCVVGNHGRHTVKPRCKDRVFTSYEWNIYQGLKRHFAGNADVQFLIPDETDAFFEVLGHRYLLTHGDCLGVRGGDGIIGALGPIARGAIKVGRSEAQIDRDFQTLLMGHWHTYIPHSDATQAVVNGSMIGYNEYARLMLRVPYSRPTQALWFQHGVYGITATWPVYLDCNIQANDFYEWVSWQQKKEAK